MTSNSLNGCRLLLLRQTTDNQRLREQIIAHHGCVFEWPALEIIPNTTNNSVEIKQQINAAKACIFISKNAAKLAFPWIKQLKQKQIFTVGMGTASILKKQGIREIYTPQEFNSEALLKLKQLTQVTDANIVIFKGTDGRKKLQQQLNKKGAKVTSVDLYSRESTQMSSQQAEKIKQFCANGIQITSTTAAQALDKADQRFTLFDKQRMVVLAVSERVCKVVRKLGYCRVFNTDSIQNIDTMRHLLSLSEQIKQG